MHSGQGLTLHADISMRPDRVSGRVRTDWTDPGESACWARHPAVHTPSLHGSESRHSPLTIKRITVAVGTDGSAVLALGNLGPYAALPVMEVRPRCSSSSPASTRGRSHPRLRRDRGRRVSLPPASGDQPGGPRRASLLRDRTQPPPRPDISGPSTTISTVRPLSCSPRSPTHPRVGGEEVGRRPDRRRRRRRHSGGAAAARTEPATSGLRPLWTLHAGRADLDATRIGADPDRRWLVENTNADNFTGALREGVAGAEVFMRHLSA